MKTPAVNKLMTMASVARLEIEKKKEGMKAKKVLAWHFTNGMKLRDGTPLEVGKTYEHMGPLAICNTGYHASIDICDALSYAPGFQVSRVECSGEMVQQLDKLVCKNRKVLWTLDAKEIVLEWTIRVTTDAVKKIKKVCTNKAWNEWADLWISGKDRSSAAAAYAADAIRTAANAAYAAAYAADAIRTGNAAAYAADAIRTAANASAIRTAADAAIRTTANAASAAREKYSGWLVAMITRGRGKKKGKAS